MTPITFEQVERLIVEVVDRNIHVHLANHDVVALDVVNGPPMVEHPAIRSGRPTSLWDIQAALWRVSVAPFLRVVPVDRNFDRPGPTIDNANQFEYVTVTKLHDEWTKQNKWRGRPSAFTKFNVETLVKWRNDVFQGNLTIRELARHAEVSEPAASRFAHGETLWYV